MDMRMMPLIMKSSIPHKMLYRDSHCLCNLWCFASYQFSPHIAIIISKTNCILSFQWQNKCPDVAVMFRSFFCHLIQINFFIWSIPQCVSLFSSFCSWSFGKVANIVFHAVFPCQTFFGNFIDQFHSVFSCWILQVVFILLFAAFSQFFICF